MKDWISLGSSPVDEDCAQVGSRDYSQRSRIEMAELKRMMQEIHPEIDGGWYFVKSFDHEFGTYHELCARYDDERPETCDWAFDAEGLVPEHWDEQAKNALAYWMSQYKLKEKKCQTSTIN